MKKSLVLITVLVAVVAFAGLAFAKGPIACPPGKVDVKFVPSKGKPAAPKCITVPCPPQQVKVPGGPYAVVPGVKKVMIPKTTDVYRDLCQGKAKGACQLCGPCAPSISWSCKWKTTMVCGKYTYLVPSTKPTKKVQPLQCTVVPVPPKGCAW